MNRVYKVDKRGGFSPGGVTDGDVWSTDVAPLTGRVCVILPTDVAPLTGCVRAILPLFSTDVASLTG